MSPPPYFSPTPHPLLPIVPSDQPPFPGQIVVGYMVYESSSSCVVRPDLQRLTSLGWCSVFLLGIVFWPIMCVPCCLGACYDDGLQVPVYQ